MRWRLILPILGLTLFAFVSYRSFRNPVLRSANGRYFWWGTIRLDTDPLNKRHLVSPCKENPNTAEACIDWDDLEYFSASPGLLAALLAFSALPAFIAGLVIVTVLGRFGISQVSSFMVSMPLLLAAWYYFVGWLIDRRRSKRSANLG
jgi:hypothetical protein